MKKTKIVCTMGPNTDNREIMKELALNGMDVARFNFSHGDHAEHRHRLEILESVREELGIPIASLLDTKGPEIRTGKLKDGKKVTLKEGDLYTLTTEEIVGDETRGYITSQILDLAFIFLVVDQIRRFRIPCHRLVFQLLPLLGILPYVQRLAFHYIVAAGNHRTHDAVESSQNECGEEHDARTQTKRSEERVNVNRLGSRKSLPHP